MWPKVFAQLVELLPHVARLIPMADMFFTTKTASEKANEAALKSLSETVRTDLGQVTTSTAGLYRQLQDQSAQIAQVAADANLARAALKSQADRLGELQMELASLRTWIRTAVFLLVVLVAIAITILLRTR